MSHSKTPFFFCVTMFLMQVLDIISTELCLNLGYPELNPFYSLPITVIKLLLPFFYYGIYIFAYLLCNEKEFKTFMKVYSCEYVMFMVIYFIILINNFSVLTKR